MSDDGMFCPYKKSTKREVSYSWISRTEITTERFGWCSEKKCMVLKMKWVEGSHYWESSIRILEKLYPELLEKKLQSWLDEYFKDFL